MSTPAQGPGTRMTVNRRLSTETKVSWKTSEFVFYLLAVIGVFIASAVVDADEDGQFFSSQKAWTLVTALTIGYMLSRGLAKSGSREPYDETIDRGV